MVIVSMPFVRNAIAVGSVVLALVAACSRGDAAHTASSGRGSTPQAPAPASTPDVARLPTAPDTATAPDFATVSKLINDAIAADKLPGAVVVIATVARLSSIRLTARASLRANPG